MAASAGCITVSVGAALGIKGFEVVMKRAVFLAIITLLAGGMLIMLDLGNPLNAWRLLTSPNFGSPLGWLLIFYLLYLVLLIIDFWLIHIKEFGKAKIFGILAPLAAIAVHSTLGAVFGFASVRGYFGGGLAPLYFIIIAIVIGTALLLFVTTLQYKVTRKEMGPELRSMMLSLGKFLAMALGILIFFIAWKNLTGISSSVETTAEAYRYMLFGPAAWWYWGIAIGMGLIIPIILMLNRATRNLNGILAASSLVVVGMFAARIEFTFGGQVVALNNNLQHLQWPFASYTASLTEVGVVLLAFAVVALLYTWGSKKLALESVAEHV